MCLLKPTKDITHDPATGTMKIRTITTFKNFNMDFNIGEEFTEDLQAVDGRTCQVCVGVFLNMRADMCGHVYRPLNAVDIKYHCLQYTFASLCV